MPYWHLKSNFQSNNPRSQGGSRKMSGQKINHKCNKNNKINNNKNNKNKVTKFNQINKLRKNKKKSAKKNKNKPKIDLIK